MIKYFLILTLFLSTTFAAKNNRTFDCTKIFEERKLELVERLEHIDEQEQALEALREATTQLLDKKKVKLDAQIAKMKKLEDGITLKEDNIKKLIAKNEKVLNDIKTAKLSKISTLYAKMKAASAAGIFAKMDTKEATDILTTLPPKVLGKIFAKMDAQKAAELTHEMSLLPEKK